MIHIDIPLSSLITSKSLTTNGSSPWQCDLPLPVLHPGRRKLACMPCLSPITFLLLRRKKINAKERKGFCWLYVLLKCGPAGVRPSSWERGEGEMGVDWETSSSHSAPYMAPYESQLGSWSSTISNVILPSGNLNVFIMMSSAQVFL